MKQSRNKLSHKCRFQRLKKLRNASFILQASTKESSKDPIFPNNIKNDRSIRRSTRSDQTRPFDEHRGRTSNRGQKDISIHVSRVEDQRKPGPRYNQRGCGMKRVGRKVREQPFKFRSSTLQLRVALRSFRSTLFFIPSDRESRSSLYRFILFYFFFFSLSVFLILLARSRILDFEFDPARSATSRFQGRNQLRKVQQHASNLSRVQTRTMRLRRAEIAVETFRIFSRERTRQISARQRIGGPFRAECRRFGAQFHALTSRAFEDSAKCILSPASSTSLVVLYPAISFLQAHPNASRPFPFPLAVSSPF